jgi:hypothetical protein
MESSKNRIKQVFFWFMPSIIEVSIYIFLTVVTFVMSGQDIVKDLLFVTEDFNPIRSGIASIDGVLQNIVGERVAGSLSLAIFWGTVGLFVNLLWWLGSNFSTELNNDLVFSKYVHPEHTDPKAQLREFITKTFIRTTVFIIGVVYINFFFSQGLPRVSMQFGDIIKFWEYNKDIKVILITFLSQIVMLHAFVVLTRLLLLRKQIFDR